MIPRLWRQRPVLVPVRPEWVEGARAVLARDESVHALEGARFEELVSAGTADTEFSAQIHGSEVAALVWHGVSLSVMGAQRRNDIAELARHGARFRRRFSSIVGEASVVREAWRAVQFRLGPAREVRDPQPLLEWAGPASAAESARETPDLAVRQARLEEERLVFPAAVAMFREEVGTDPLRADGGRAYAARVRSLIASGRTYVVRENDTIVFKADVGARFGAVSQIHGVWVDPEYRGRGIASEAMASVARLVAEQHSPRVTLYVNEFNVPARRAYENAGFVQGGELATVLL